MGRLKLCELRRGFLLFYEKLGLTVLMWMRLCPLFEVSHWLE